MGTLGQLLLQGAVKGADAVTGGAAAGAGSGAAQPPGDSAPAPASIASGDIVILSPALGFPQLVNENSRQFTVILLSKSDSISRASYMNALRWVNMSQARKLIEGEALPQGALTTVPGVCVNHKTLSLADYRTKVKKGWVLFDQGGRAETKIRGRLNHKLLNIYESKGFNTLVSLCIEINTSVFSSNGSPVKELFSLWAPGQSELVRDILKGLKPAKYSDCPMYPDRTIKTLKRYRYLKDKSWKQDPGHQDLVMLHPVMIGAPASYLNLAHVTDMHISRRWDHMASKIFDTEASTDAKNIARAMNKVNSNYEAVCHEILKHNNTAGKTPIHAVIQTGDLIDYCRGDNNEGGKVYSNDRFEYNTNWMLYYQLLVNNYDLPTYTVLGNHDWHMSQYAPHPVFTVGGNFGTLALLGGFLNVTAALSSLIFKGISDAVDKALGGFISTLFIIIFMWFLIEACMVYWWMFGGSVDYTNWGFGYVTLAGFLFGFFHAALNIISYFCDNQFAYSMLIANSIWLALIIGVAIAGDWLDCLGMTYVVDQLRSRDTFGEMNKDQKAKEAKKIEQFYDDNLHDMDLFGPQSLFYLDEDSVIWYSFVINPFMDYIFDYQNMNIAMFDWGEHEGIELPPIAEDALSDGQFSLLKTWGAVASEKGKRLKDQGKAVRPILGSHFAVFAQENPAKLDRLAKGVPWDDGELQIGIIGENRLQLIKALDSIKAENAPPITLGGHTHIYGAFQTEIKGVDVDDGFGGSISEQKHVVTFFDSEDMPGDSSCRVVKNFKQDQTMYAITICSGPPGDAKEDKDKPGLTKKRPPGYRRIFFKDNGEIESLEEQDIPVVETPSS